MDLKDSDHPEIEVFVPSGADTDDQDEFEKDEEFEQINSAETKNSVVPLYRESLDANDSKETTQEENMNQMYSELLQIVTII